MFEKKDKKEKESKSTPAENKAFSEKIVDALLAAEKLLESAPQTAEVRGGAIKLKAAIGAILQAGKFAEVKKDKE
jgi:hypothetical protein